MNLFTRAPRPYPDRLLSTSMRTPQEGTLVVRPPRPSAKATLGLAGLTLAITGAIGYVNAGDGGALIMCAATLLVLTPVLLRQRNSHAVVTPTAFGKAGLLGRPRMRSKADAASVLLVTLPPRMRTELKPTPTLVVLDHAGRPLMRLAGPLYQERDLHRLAVALRLPATSYPGVLSYQEVQRRHPGAIPWTSRHLYLATVLIGVGLVAGVLAIAVVVFTLDYFLL